MKIRATVAAVIFLGFVLGGVGWKESKAKQELIQFLMTRYGVRNLQPTFEKVRRVSLFPALYEVTMRLEGDQYVFTVAAGGMSEIPLPPPES